MPCSSSCQWEFVKPEQYIPTCVIWKSGIGVSRHFSEGLDGWGQLPWQLRVEDTLHGPEPSLSLCNGARRDTTPASPSHLHGPVPLCSPKCTGILAGDFQLEQEAEVRDNLRAELSKEIRSLKMSQRHLEAALAHKDDRISVSHPSQPSLFMNTPETNSL